MKTIIPSVKGTREFYPREMALRNWLYSVLHDVSESYGYQEYDGPYLEKIDLYAAKSGEELVKEQAFCFPDRGGDLITLRPELTPSLARLVAQKQNELVYPLRWWSFGPFWRYERPQKGRTREFFQWNIDMIGVNSPEADAELISIAIAFFKKVGLTPNHVKVMVNDRKLMDGALAELGIVNESRRFVFRLVDRRDKMRPEDWERYALEGGLTQEQLDGLKELLKDNDLWKRSAELQRVFAVLEAMGMRDYVVFDPQVIRGLDYYTGTVFEARDQDREGRAILGGGHYDNLLADVGGDPLPGVGFAMGDVMLPIVIEKYGLLPEFKQPSAEVLMTVFDEAGLPKSFAFANELRECGLRVVAIPDASKLQKQFKLADRIGARFVVIIGPDEEAAGQATVKDLVAHEQATVDKNKVADWIWERLA